MEETRITAYRDGPLIVRGPFRLEDQDGNEIEAEEDGVVDGPALSGPLGDGEVLPRLGAGARGAGPFGATL